MLWSLMVAAVLLSSQTMALNSTYAYIPGFFAQDDPKADANAIGAVRKYGCWKALEPRLKVDPSREVARSIWSVRFEPRALANIPAQGQGFGLGRWTKGFR